MALALTGGRILTSLASPSIVDADLVIEDGQVEALGTAPDGARRIDCSGCLVVPGNVCAHMHLYSALARGMPYALEAPSNFVQILQRVWWRLDRALDDELIRVSAQVGGIEALLSGTTTLIDHHASPNAIEGSLDVMADALEGVGLRSILCYEVTDRDGPERARAGVEENRRFLGTRRELTRGMVGAHASFTLSEETLAACAQVGGAAGVGVHIHVAEDAADEADAVARFGLRVVHRLADAGVLDERSLLAHCVHLDEAEIELVRESGLTVAHNPRSNMNNSVGYAPVAALGERVALGTDGIGSDMFEESRAAYWRAREADVFRGPGWAVERLARGAAFVGALFGEPSLGRIEPGAPADLVVLEYAPPTPLLAENLPGHWVFGLDARHVRDVLVAGEVVVVGRRPTRVDADEVAARAEEGAKRLWRRLEEIDPHPFEPAAT